MKAVRGEFIRKMGCLRLEMQHLNTCLRTNNFSGIETESRTIQDMLIDLVKQQRKLGKAEQITLKPRFVSLREEAMQSLEIARRILDDSLEAMMELLRLVQSTGAYGPDQPGSSFIVDRKA